MSPSPPPISEGPPADRIVCRMGTDSVSWPRPKTRRVPIRSCSRSVSVAPAGAETYRPEGSKDPKTRAPFSWIPTSASSRGVSRAGVSTLAPAQQAWAWDGDAQARTAAEAIDPTTRNPGVAAVLGNLEGMLGGIGDGPGEGGDEVPASRHGEIHV